MADHAVGDAARLGFDLDLRPETPVVPDEFHTWLTERTTWGEIETLVRHLSATGCGWVNLRLSLDADGGAVVRPPTCVAQPDTRGPEHRAHEPSR